jgi:hypothetical protein
MSWVVKFVPWLFYVWEKTALYTKQEIGCAPEVVWTLERREKKIYCLGQDSNPWSASAWPNHYTTPTLFWLLELCSIIKNNPWTNVYYASDKSIGCLNSPQVCVSAVSDNLWAEILDQPVKLTLCALQCTHNRCTKFHPTCFGTPLLPSSGTLPSS